MRRRSLRRGAVLGVGLAMGGAAAFGQTMYVIKPTGESSITAVGGEVLTLEVWISGNFSAEKLKEFRVTMPCSASGGTAGSIDCYASGGPKVYDGIVNSPVDPDYVFSGISHITSGASSGKCPIGVLGGYPSAIRGVANANATAQTTPKYLATVTCTVSTNAQGTFTLAPAYDSGTCPAAYGSHLLKGIATPTCYSTTYTPITINVPTGRCCKSTGCTLPQCTPSVTQHYCQNTIGGVFTAGANCVSACPCQTGSNCSDGNPNTSDTCTSGVCSHGSITPVYADIYPCGGNGLVDATDIAAVIDAFQGQPYCPVCHGLDVCGGGGGGGGGAETAADASVLSTARITLSAGKNVGGRGELIPVDVYASEVSKLSSYHVAVEVSGGRSGTLTLETVSVDRDRADYVFPHQERFVLLSDKTRHTLDMIHLDGEVTAEGQVYLGTFAFRASDDASGKFRIELQADNGATLTTSRNKPTVPSDATGATIVIR